MPYVKLNINEGTKNIALEVGDANEQHITSIISGAFGVFGVSPQNKDIVIQLNEKALASLVPSAPTVDLKTKQAKEIEQAKQQISPPTLTKAVWQDDDNKPSERKRQIELQGTSRTLNTPIGEHLDKAVERLPDRPEWYDTGIKYKDGVPHYRLRYWCQNKSCENQGNQYILLDDKEVECHNCKTKHKVRPTFGVVSDNGIPKTDRYGNFFRADELA